MSTEHKQSGRGPILRNLLMVTTMLFGISVGDAAVNILNPTGGTNSTDGLKIFTERGQFLICRNGLRQIYNGSGGNCTTQPTLGDLGIGLQVVGQYRRETLSAYSGSSVDFNETKTAAEVSNTLTGTGPWTNVNTMSGTVNGKTYSYVVTTRYTSPNGYADVEIQVTVPQGVTEAPKLFIASDFSLDDQDRGLGLTQLIDGRRMVVQYQGPFNAPTAVGGIYEAAPQPGVQTAFDSYMEGWYKCTFGNYAASDCFDGAVPNSLPPTWDDEMGPASEFNLNYPNWVDDDPDQDAGVGVSWTLPTAAGTYTIKTILWFTGGAFPLPPPTVTTVQPSSGSTAGGTRITITGTDFTGATAVTVGGSPCTPIVVNNAGTEIVCTTSAHAPARVSVEVTTQGGTNAANTLFTYVEIGGAANHHCRFFGNCRQ